MHHQRNVDRQPLHWLSRRKFGPKPNIGPKGSIQPECVSLPDRPACSCALSEKPRQGANMVTNSSEKIVTGPPHYGQNQNAAARRRLRSCASLAECRSSTASLAQTPQVRPEAEYRAKRVDPIGVRMPTGSTRLIASSGQHVREPAG